MKDWTWATENQPPVANLCIEFSEFVPQGDLRNFVQTKTLDGLVLCSPEVAHSILRGEVANCYMDEFSYEKLSFFTGRSHFGTYYQLIVTKMALRCECYGIRCSTQDRGVTELLKSLLEKSDVKVENWRVSCDDFGSSYVKIAEGDHQALLDYLDL